MQRDARDERRYTLRRKAKRTHLQAARIAIVIPADHRVDLRVPAELPEGPTEVIVLIAPKPTAAPLDRRAALGMDRGTVQIADDFDAPLPEDLLRAFEGET